MTETHMYQVEDGWIETFTGRQFRFLDPEPREIDVVDIAHALSMLCRYNGHTKCFYSVAEHSVFIADWLYNNKYDPRMVLTGLLHDAAEAYIGDMPRPIKVTMPNFKEMEERIDRAVAQRFGIFYPFPPIIKELDTRILCDERQQFMSDSEHEWGVDGLEPLGVTFKCWLPLPAEKAFLEMYSWLYPRVVQQDI